ncbi:MAG: prepilin-type N-terminal cleavage/methylation domain-containing protein [Patescibacteria group bacterium]
MFVNSKPKTYNLKLTTGFTLIEVIVSIAMFTLVILIAYEMYSLGQNVYRRGGDEMETWQNARAALDRMTREIRQAESLATALPATSDDIANPPANELIFQDGHDTSQITYIRYYLNGANLNWQRVAYYFSIQPDLYVAFNSKDQFGNPPNQIILDDRVIGEYFSDLDFWGNGNLINIIIQLSKNGRAINLMTAVYGRNL